MSRETRGRPRLGIASLDIVMAIRSHGQIVAAARELGCSPAYVHARLKFLGITMAQVLEAEDPPGLRLENPPSPLT
jgi:molybdenum-dependent DNA-binding transcriptional regulator ModE